MQEYNGDEKGSRARAKECSLGSLAAFFRLFSVYIRPIFDLFSALCLSALWLKLTIIFFCLLKIRPIIFSHIFFGLQTFGLLLYNPKHCPKSEKTITKINGICVCLAKLLPLPLPVFFWGLFQDLKPIMY